MTKRILSIVERLTRHTEYDPNSGCHLWSGATYATGYGLLNVVIDGRRTTRGVHRLAWEAENGPIPEGEGYHGIEVCHTCDTPPCLNPAHLFLGTHLENVRDMHTKGRANTSQGERHRSAKLAETDVVAIRARYAAGGVLMREIAAEYDVTLPTIRMIVRRRAWKSVT